MSKYIIGQNLGGEEHFFIQSIIAANKIAGLNIFIEKLNVFDHSYGSRWKKKTAVTSVSKFLK